MTKKISLGLVICCIIAGALYMGINTRTSEGEDATPAHLKGINPDEISWREKTPEYWKSVLTEEQYDVCRGHGTERPFTGKYCNSYAHGEYRCACCGQLLFSSKKKFDSGTGWPSFTEAAEEGVLEYFEDKTLGMTRTEVRCNRCGAHLGHVFDDGPPPTHKRFCINSVCLYKHE